MQLYNIVLRLGGNAAHELVKSAVTAPEVIVFRDLHGDGSVTRVTAAGSVKVDLADLRQELEQRYGQPRIQELFGKGYTSELPQKLPDGLTKEAEPGSAAMQKSELEAENERLRARLRAANIELDEAGGSPEPEDKREIAEDAEPISSPPFSADSKDDSDEDDVSEDPKPGPLPPAPGGRKSKLSSAEDA